MFSISDKNATLSCGFSWKRNLKLWFQLNTQLQAVFSSKNQTQLQVMFWSDIWGFFPKKWHWSQFISSDFWDLFSKYIIRYRKKLIRWHLWLYTSGWSLGHQISFKGLRTSDFESNYTDTVRVICIPFDSIIDETLKALRRLQSVKAIQSGGVRTGSREVTSSGEV